MAANVDDIILKKLQAYGDTVLEGKDKKKNKKSLDNKSPGPSSDREKKQKKKKKKNIKQVPDDFHVDDFSDDEINQQNEVELSGHERRLHEMSEQLGLSEFKQQLNETQEKLKEQKKAKAQQEPEVIVFNSHKSKKALKKEAESSGGQQSGTMLDFDMRQARYDVQKFGIKGFEGSQKEEAMTALLIKLGAKPPKNKYVNYKDFQEDRRRQKELEVQKRETDRKNGLKITKGGKGKKRSHDRNDIGHIDGQIGKWKSGVLVVKKDELKGFKKKPKLK